jgi:hypothetical protein
MAFLAGRISGSEGGCSGRRDDASECAGGGWLVTKYWYGDW